MGLSVQPGQRSAAPSGSWLTRTEDVVGGGSVSFEAKPIPAPHPALPQRAFWSRPKAPEFGCRPAAPRPLTTWTGRGVGLLPTPAALLQPGLHLSGSLGTVVALPCASVSASKRHSRPPQRFLWGHFSGQTENPSRPQVRGEKKTSFKLAEYPGSRRAVLLEAFKHSTQP